MRLRTFIEPQQGATYGDQLRFAQASERLGFDGFFRSDHFLGFSGDGGVGPTDAWTTLAGIARETSTIRLGTLVSSVTFRYPGVLAVQVAQVDEMSGGRVELGLGTGWHEREHRALGVAFPDKRFGILEEQLEVITGLWSTPLGQTYHHRGLHYELVDSPALPKPVQSPLPIIVGGRGASRTPALAARYAHEFNLPFPDLRPDGELDIADVFARVDAACEAVGRDPQSLVHSVALTTVVGEDAAEVELRASRIGRSVDDLRRVGLAGTPDEIAERLAWVASTGAEVVYLQVLDLHDLEQLDQLAELVPGVAVL